MASDILWFGQKLAQASIFTIRAKIGKTKSLHKLTKYHTNKEDHHETIKNQPTTNHSRSNQRLIKGEQHLIQLEDIIIAVLDEIFYDDIKLAAMGQGITRTGNEIFRLRQIQLQCNCKSQARRLRRLIIPIVPYLRKKLAVDICFLIYFGILFPSLIDEMEQCLRKSCIQLA